MSIIFFGTPEFAVPSLLSLIRSGEKVELVVTQPDKRKGRSHELTPPAVKVSSLKEGLTTIQPITLDDLFIERLRNIKPELIVVVAYGKILPRSILQIPERGCINVHASLLPKYRGAAPIAWAIIRGERETGVTTMLMDKGLDTGPVLLRRKTDISSEDTAESLSRRLSEIGASLLIETIAGIRKGWVEPSSQEDGSSYAPALKKDDGQIDWSMSAADIFNFIRGMQPWPGAYTHINNERVIILKTKQLEGEGAKGRIFNVGKDELIVATGSGLLSIISLQPSGKKPMPASSFIHGRKLRAGMLLS